MSAKDLLRDIHLLDVKILKLQKEMQTALTTGNRSELKSDFTQIHDLIISAEQARKKEGHDLFVRLKKIKCQVETFCHEVKNLKPTPDYVEKVKLMMEAIEVLITELKEDQRACYEDLLRTEVALWQECVVLEKKLDSWTSQTVATDGETGSAGGPASGSRRPPLSSERDITQNLPVEVADYERFLDQTGGSRGGWTDDDHQAFLRIRQRYLTRIQKEETSAPSTFSGRRPGADEDDASSAEPQRQSVRSAVEEFLQEAARLIIGKTVDRAREHETWYREHTRLLQRKKEAIARWKERRKNERLRNVGDGESDSDGADELRPDGGATATARTEAEQAEWERRRREIEAKRAAVDAWRAQKAIEKYRAREEEAERTRREREAEEEARRRAQEAKKAQVALFKEEKESRERILFMSQWEEQQKEKAALIANVEVHSARIQKRNDRFLSSKLEKKKAQEEMERKKQERLEKLKSTVQVHVERDAQRLLQPTAGWRERVIATEAEAQRPSGPVLACNSAIQNVSHRAVPAWRRNN